MIKHRQDFHLIDDIYQSISTKLNEVYNELEIKRKKIKLYIVNIRHIMQKQG